MTLTTRRQFLKSSAAAAAIIAAPAIVRGQNLNSKLQVMASPWSAPGWMKTTDSLVQGQLRPEFYGAFAHYMVRYVEAMKAEGVPIFAHCYDFPLPTGKHPACVGPWLKPSLDFAGWGPADGEAIVAGASITIAAEISPSPAARSANVPPPAAVTVSGSFGSPTPR